jgi:ParB family chromosome partitioning protein
MSLAKSASRKVLPAGKKAVGSSAHGSPGTQRKGIVEIDPALVDPSPFPDRFPDDDESLHDALLESMKTNGQILPILVRSMGNGSDRYQCVYGHRRLRVAALLGRKVQAIVGDLSTRDLVLAQSIENSLRVDPSFIERATFAKHLEAANFERNFIKNAVSVGDAEASRMIRIAKSIPADVVQQIGRAPKIGRDRWQALADALSPPPGSSRINPYRRLYAALKRKSFLRLDSDARFLAVLRDVRGDAGKPDPAAGSVNTEHGLGLASYAFRQGVCRMTIAREHEAFAKHVLQQLPTMFESFATSKATPP